VLLAAQGFTYHGPRGRIGFDPRVTPENHQSFFTAAEGWGTFSQKREGKTQSNEIRLAWGKLRVAELSLGIPAGVEKAVLTIEAAGDPATTGKPVRSEIKAEGGKVVVAFEPAMMLKARQTLRVKATW
jgi:hypothetical protein